MQLPCSIEELAQSFIDAQTLLGDVLRISGWGADRDDGNSRRQLIKQALIDQNPGLFPLAFDQETIKEKE